MLNIRAITPKKAKQLYEESKRELNEQIIADLANKINAFLTLNPNGGDYWLKQDYDSYVKNELIALYLKAGWSTFDFRHGVSFEENDYWIEIKP